jgi:hypothetical protein
MSSWPTRQSRVNKAFCTSQHSGQQEAGSACLADLFPCLMLAFSSPFLPRLPPSDRCSYGGQVLLLVPWQISHQLCRGRGIKLLSKAWETTLYRVLTWRHPWVLASWSLCRGPQPGRWRTAAGQRTLSQLSSGQTKTSKDTICCRLAHTVTTWL